MCILMLTSIGLCDVVLEAMGPKLRQATRPRENQVLVFRTKRANERTIWIADSHRDDGKRFLVRADERLSAFLQVRWLRSLRSHPAASALLRVGDSRFARNH
jgi:hypothetical protein